MKLTRFLILGAIAFSAAACSESTSEFHYFHVESPKTLIYADQSTDTLIIQSTDSWEATTVTLPLNATDARTAEPAYRQAG